MRSVSPSEVARRLQAERRGAPFLLFLDGAGSQRVVELEDAGDRLTIGRQAASDVALTWDPEVSRLHAVLERVGTERRCEGDGRCDATRTAVGHPGSAAGARGAVRHRG
jgi:hypothetical protein